MVSYIDIINAFWNWRIVNSISPNETVLFFALLHCANTCGWKTEFTPANSMLMALCDGMPKTSFIRARNSLIQSGLISYIPGKKGQAGRYKIIIGTKNTPIFGTNSGTNSGTNTVPIAVPIPAPYIDKTRQDKNNNTPQTPQGGTRAESDQRRQEIDRAIGHLNDKAGTDYRRNTAKTRTLINARLNEGFTLDDLLAVIDKKAEEWLGTEFEKFLRPETLFGAKFEGYLNSQQSAPRPRKKPPRSSKFADIEDDML